MNRWLKGYFISSTYAQVISNQRCITNRETPCSCASRFLVSISRVQSNIAINILVPIGTLHSFYLSFQDCRLPNVHESSRTCWCNSLVYPAIWVWSEGKPLVRPAYHHAGTNFEGLVSLVHGEWSFDGKLHFHSLKKAWVHYRGKLILKI